MNWKNGGIKEYRLAVKRWQRLAYYACRCRGGRERWCRLEDWKLEMKTRKKVMLCCMQLLRKWIAWLRKAREIRHIVSEDYKTYHKREHEKAEHLSRSFRINVKGNEIIQSSSIVFAKFKIKNPGKTIFIQVKQLMLHSNLNFPKNTSTNVTTQKLWDDTITNMKFKGNLRGALWKFTTKTSTDGQGEEKENETRREERRGEERRGKGRYWQRNRKGLQPEGKKLDQKKNLDSLSEMRTFQTWNWNEFRNSRASLLIWLTASRSLHSFVFVCLWLGRDNWQWEGRMQLEVVMDKVRKWKG